MHEAIQVLTAQGAVIVDPANIPSVVDTDPEKSLLLAGESRVLRYGMIRDFNAWLGSLGESAPVATLTELRLNNRTEYCPDGGVRWVETYWNQRTPPDDFISENFTFGDIPEMECTVQAEMQGILLSQPVQIIAQHIAFVVLQHPDN